MSKTTVWLYRLRLYPRLQPNSALAEFALVFKHEVFMAPGFADLDFVEYVLWFFKSAEGGGLSLRR